MAYDFTPSEFSLVWEAFNKYADPDTHILSVADLHAVIESLVDTVNAEDITWFIRHVNAVDTGKLSLVKLIKGVGDLIDRKGSRKKRPYTGRRFTWREIADLFKLFLSIDVDKSGEISFSELYKALRFINPRAKVNDALSMFSVLDVDKSHAIDFPEFVRGISMGGDNVGPITAPETGLTSNGVQRGRPATKSTQRSPDSHPPSYLETQEIFRNVEGDAYGHEASSPHFPKRLPTSLPSSKGSPKSYDTDTYDRNTFSASPPKSASPQGSRLYNNWAQKNAKPAAVLDSRVPTTIISTKPSFFPSSDKTPPPTHLTPLPPSSAVSSTPLSISSPMSKPASPPKRRLPQIDPTK